MGVGGTGENSLFLIPATTQSKASGIFIAPLLFGQERLANDIQTISALILIADYGNFIP